MIYVIKLLKIPKSNAWLDGNKSRYNGVTSCSTVALEGLWFNFLLMLSITLLPGEPMTKNEIQQKKNLLA